MKSDWKKEKCATKPPQFQQIAENIYMQRRNIVKSKALDEHMDTGYECESRRISKDVYQILIEEMYSPAYESLNALLEEQATILANTELNLEYSICLQEMNMEL